MASEDPVRQAMLKAIPRLRAFAISLTGNSTYADDVRHITWRWIPFPERRGLEEMTLGPTAYPAVKAKGDSSMPIKQKWSEDAYGHGLQGPRDKVRAALLEPQPPVMQAYISRHSV
jgi:hypothetical protein